MSAPLAEVIEEGRRAFAARGHEAPFVTDKWQMFILINGPRLLAVAEAAVEMRKEATLDTTHPESRCACRRCRVMRAFDAAARGEK